METQAIMALVSEYGVVREAMGQAPSSGNHGLDHLRQEESSLWCEILDAIRTLNGESVEDDVCILTFPGVSAHDREDTYEPEA